MASELAWFPGMVDSGPGCWLSSLDPGSGDMLQEHGSVSSEEGKGGGGWQCLLRGKVGLPAERVPRIGPTGSQELVGSVNGAPPTFTPTPVSYRSTTCTLRIFPLVRLPAGL